MAWYFPSIFRFKCSQRWFCFSHFRSTSNVQNSINVFISLSTNIICVRTTPQNTYFFLPLTHHFVCQKRSLSSYYMCISHFLALKFVLLFKFPLRNFLFVFFFARFFEFCKHHTSIEKWSNHRSESMCIRSSGDRCVCAVFCSCLCVRLLFNCRQWRGYALVCQWENSQKNSIHLKNESTTTKKWKSFHWFASGGLNHDDYNSRARPMKAFISKLLTEMQREKKENNKSRGACFHLYVICFCYCLRLRLILYNQ